MLFCIDLIIIFVGVLKAYKYRIYPTADQQVLIDKHIGAVRFVYNLSLEVKQTAYAAIKKNYTAFDLMKQLPDLKEECVWLKEVNAQSLQQAVVNMETAYKMFFKGAKEFPKYKSKHSGSLSFQIPQDTKIDFNKNTISVPKIKAIKTVFHRRFTGNIKTTTISKTPTGKYFISILVDNKKENPAPKPVKEKTSIGLDLGIKSLVVTSDGEVFNNPKYLKRSIDRLKILQHRASKKKKGSSNNKKAYKKLAVLHEKITNQRKDFLHKISSKLISENQTICIEDLAINNMVKNHNLSRSIHDAGWSMFVLMLRYKALWRGKNILQIGRFEPSSKLCSNCGQINKSLTLADREWICVCGSKHDRDINAAINIKNFALKNSGTEHAVKPAEPPTMVGAMKQEACKSSSQQTKHV